MNEFECLKVVGEGSYGVVMKCIHKETGQIVAIKKFQETEEKVFVKKVALREFRLLKKLNHDHVVQLFYAFKENKFYHFVFEYMEATLLNKLEESPEGLGFIKSRELIFQVVKAIEFIHRNRIVHRDLKPENILLSKSEVVKICDLGFARKLENSSQFGKQKKDMTEYVATRWYRSPELLVADSNYKYEVDIWAIGCVFAEMMSGCPLFPGDSDIDQIFLITKLNGNLCARHQKLFLKIYSGNSNVICEKRLSKLSKLYHSWPKTAVDFLERCLEMDPESRASANHLLNHRLFSIDNFFASFTQILQKKIRNDQIFNYTIATKTKSHTSSSELSPTKRPVSAINLKKSEFESQKNKLQINLPPMKKNEICQKVFKKIKFDDISFPSVKDLQRKFQNQPIWLISLESSSKNLKNVNHVSNLDLDFELPKIH